MSEKPDGKKPGKYPEKMRIKVLTMLETGMTVREVAQKTGIGKSTINAWKKSISDDARAKLEKLGTQQRAAFVSRAWSDIELAQRAGSRQVEMCFMSAEALSVLVDAVNERGELSDGEKDKLIEVLQSLRQIDLRQLAKWIEVNATQARLMSGEATENVQLSGGVTVKRLEDL